jgi:hypothetical protein
MGRRTALALLLAVLGPPLLVAAITTNYGDLAALTLTATGDGNGARIQMDVNTATPTYDSGEAGIHLLQLPADPVARAVFSDGDGSEPSQIGPALETWRILLYDPGLGYAPANPSCGTVGSSSQENLKACNVGTAAFENEVYVLEDLRVVLISALDAATEDCTLYLSYAPDHADKSSSWLCSDPKACGTSTQIPIVHVGTTDPGNSGSDYWIKDLGEEWTHDLGKLEVRGYWRVMIHDRFRCDSGDDQGNPCAYDTDCTGAATCVEDNPAACSVFTGAEVQVRGWKYTEVP